MRTPKERTKISLQQDFESVLEDNIKLKAALLRIVAEDGPGLDGSPGGPAYKVASAVLAEVDGGGVQYMDYDEEPFPPFRI